MSKFFSGSLNKEAEQIFCIIAGGSGTRFWPLSRMSKPKQFLSLDGKSSLIQQTSARLGPLLQEGNLLVVTAQAQADLVRQHLPTAAVLAEPYPKNTAPALAYAAIKVLSEVGDRPMVCLPADHLIANHKQLLDILSSAIELASKEDLLITIGLKPSRPETGFGYIKKGAELELQTKTTHRAFNIDQFVEKPDLQTAETYLQAGDYFWNSGMFIWRPSVILAAIEKHLPGLYKEIMRLPECFSSGREEDIEAIFSSIQAISVDYGVMEKASNVCLFPADDLQWSDVGSWDAWSLESPQSFAADLIEIDSTNSYVHAGSRTVALVGVDNLIVVDTGDALLVCSREHSQKVKDIVEELKKRGKSGLI